MGLPRLYLGLWHFASSLACWKISNSPKHLQVCQKGYKSPVNQYFMLHTVASLLSCTWRYKLQNVMALGKRCRQPLAVTTVMWRPPPSAVAAATAALATPDTCRGSTSCHRKCHGRRPLLQIELAVSPFQLVRVRQQVWVTGPGDNKKWKNTSNNLSAHWVRNISGGMSTSNNEQAYEITNQHMQLRPFFIWLRMHLKMNFICLSINFGFSLFDMLILYFILLFINWRVEFYSLDNMMYDYFNLAQKLCNTNIH